MSRALLLVCLLLAGVAAADSIQDAIDHPGRPAMDRDEDDRRKPLQAMAFSGVSAGEIVLEIGAGQGYTTELASRVVGPNGKVYAHRLSPERLIGNRLPNVVALPPIPDDFGERLAVAGLKRGSLDRVIAFFSLHDGYVGGETDMQQIYRTLLAYLKPGGELIVMDNTAPASSELEFTESVHRIDEEFLKNDLIAAGFEFVAASDILRNPDDDLESSWFEDTPSRKSGYQDRFSHRFRKPE